MKRTDILLVLASVLILLFLYTAVAKLVDMAEFKRQLAGQELPRWSKSTLLWLIPGSEILVSLLLSLSSTRLLGFYGSALLMALFTGYMGMVVFGFFDRVPCSCGGVLRSMSFEVHLLFNVFFLVLSLVGIYLFHSQKPIAVTFKKAKK
jgi:putative oxidoreductase